MGQKSEENEIEPSLKEKTSKSEEIGLPHLTPQKTLVLKLTFAMLGLSMTPTMSVVWLVRNTGNANFLYFMQLMYQGCMVLSLLQFVSTVRSRLCD